MKHVVGGRVHTFISKESFCSIFFINYAYVCRKCVYLIRAWWKWCFGNYLHGDLFSIYSRVFFFLLNELKDLLHLLHIVSDWIKGNSKIIKTSNLRKKIKQLHSQTHTKQVSGTHQSYTYKFKTTGGMNIYSTAKSAIKLYSKHIEFIGNSISVALMNCLCWKCQI